MARMSSIPPLQALTATDIVEQSASSPAAQAGLAGAFLTTLALPLLLYLAVQRAGAEELLGLSRLQLIADEHWLLPMSGLSTSLALLLPGLLVETVLYWLGRDRFGRRCYIALASFVLFLQLVDLDLQRSIGRHMFELLEVALQPQGHVAGGSLGNWVRMLLQWAVLALAATSGLSFACRQLGAALMMRLTPLLRRTLGVGAGCLLVALTLAPYLMLSAWRNFALQERAYGTLLVDLRPASQHDDTALTDPLLRELYPRLRESYRSAYPT